jgi:uncharacterized repeat protein (TIGR01451 family)
MRAKSHIKHMLQFMSAFFVCFTLLSPSLALAQSVPPPPPLPERRQLAMQSRPAGAGPALQPNTAQAAINPLNRLVFQSYRDGNWEIYTSNEDGSNALRLTNNKAIDVEPSFNHGANRIAFASNRDGDYEIFIMNADGSGLTQVTHNTTSDIYPALSPDGKQILFISYRYHKYLIYIINADGTGERSLVADGSQQAYPTWSQDGSHIVYIELPGGNLVTMKPDGTDKGYHGWGKYAADPRWSPDGSQIAFDADVNGDGFQELMVTSALTSTNAQMIKQAPPNCDLWAGSWSPDGRYLAYTVICYVYYQNTWYWSGANIQAWDSLNPNADPIPLGFAYTDQATEWNPDWKSTDAEAPVSFIAVPAFSPVDFTVFWGATDPGGSGVQYYDVKYKVQDGQWIDKLTHTTETSATFNGGINGRTVYFKVRACDNANNQEAWTADYQASTVIEMLPPQTSVNPLPEYARNSTLVTWGGIDPGGSGIKSYSISVQPGDGYWLGNYLAPTATSGIFGGILGETYYFASSGTDNAYNVEPLPPATKWDAHVTFYAWQTSGIVHDNSGVPVTNAQIALNPASINTTSSGADGSYTGYRKDFGSTYTADWSKAGYGPLPQTTNFTLDDPQSDITLPPSDNAVKGGTFEAGSLAPEAWQTGGTLPAALTTNVYHTGQSALLLGQNEWSDPFKLSDFKSSNGVANASPYLAYDSDGTAHAVWVNGINAAGNGADMSIYYASKPAGGAWSVPLDLSGPNIYSSSPVLAIDDAGTVYAAWDNGVITCRSKLKGGSWSAPANLSDSGAISLQIAVDHSGRLHFLYQDSNSLNYRVMVGGQWSARETVTDDSTSPAMAVDASGTVHVVWSKTMSFPSYSGQGIYYSSRPQDGSWTAPSLVSANGSLPPSDYAPALAVDTAGTLYAVWQTTNTGIEFAVKQPGGDWGAAVLLAGNGANARIVEYHGKIGVAFSRQYLNPSKESIFYTETPDGIHWSQPRPITPSLSNASFPNLAVGPEGRIGMVYYQYGQAIYFVEQTAADQSGDASVSQTVIIPNTISAPTLSFYYIKQGGSTQASTGFSAILHTSSGEVSLLTPQAATPDWTFKTVDMSKYSGQTVDVEFTIHQDAGGLPAWALIDDVTLGSAHPDLWVTSTNARGRPGDTVAFDVACGNRGGAPAANARLTFSLPAGLTLVSADPVPTSQSGSNLTWALGNLAPKSEGCAIHLTAQIAPAVKIPHTLAAAVKITTSSTELEVENNVIHPTVDVPRYLTYVPSVEK